MLVYANYLRFQGRDAETAIFKAIGGWLKEQLGFGLHPSQLLEDGEYNGSRQGARSWLKIQATSEEEPALYAWVLNNADEGVWGRQWVTEIGLKISGDEAEFSCVLSTEEQSTLVDNPVRASRPRLIRYVVNNVREASDAKLAKTVPGAAVKSVGPDLDSYRALLVDIDRLERRYPIVLVSPTTDGTYLVNADHLQEDLVGLAQVVQIAPDFNSYEMAEVLGSHWSAWGGAVNLIHTPTPSGYIRPRIFLSDTIEAWGVTQHSRITELMAWVTNNTNIPRRRERISMNGVAQLALRRRLQAARARASAMDETSLRQELESVWSMAEQQSEQLSEMESAQKELERQLESTEFERLRMEEEREDARKATRAKEFELQQLRDQQAKSGSGRTTAFDAERLLMLACRADQPSPSECLEIVEDLFGDRCTVLDSAHESAEESNRFAHGRQLLDLLRKLVNKYRELLMEYGDSEARKVFGRDDFAARESETTMSNQELRKKRIFEYQGQKVEMFRHLKIGVDDDIRRTIRVHFHWDSSREVIVIGYCGKHLPISSV